MINFGSSLTYSLSYCFVLERNTIVDCITLKNKTVRILNLGILVSNSPNFTVHLYRAINTAHLHANFILYAFPYSNSSVRCKLSCNYVRLLLEYCSQIWSPYTLKNIDIIEGVKRFFSQKIYCWD